MHIQRTNKLAATNFGATSLVGFFIFLLQQPLNTSCDILTFSKNKFNLRRMTRSARKFIAVIMLLWLPVFTGSALAASVSMQLSQGGCHESAASQSMSHAGMDMGEHHIHHGDKPIPADEHSPSNSVCGVCHLACTAYLAVPVVSIAAAPSAAGEITPYLVVFNSVTSVPLLPPPLVRV